MDGAGGALPSDGDLSAMYATPTANPDGPGGAAGEFARELDLFHQQFCDALNGPFAACGYVDAMPLPELYVDGVGHLGLGLAASAYDDDGGGGGGATPALAADQAELLIRQYRSASATPAGPSARMCVVRPGQFAVRNDAAWNEFLGRVVARVTGELGVGAPALATLRAMRVAGKGAAYRDQVDATQGQGVFGTLAIALPSLHDGGVDLSRYRGEKKSFFSKSWSYQNYAAWFSDVRHDLTVVKDGYCWTLVYDLVVDHRSPRLQPPFLPSAENRRGSELALRKLFEAYADRCRRPEPLVRDPPKFVMHILETESAAGELSLETLLPQDAARVQTVNEVCVPLGFEVFLARVRKVWTGPKGMARSSTQKSMRLLSAEDDPDSDREFSSGAPPQGPCEKKTGIRALGKVGGEALLFDDTVAETNQINLRPPYHEMSQADPFGPIPDSEDVKRPTKDVKYFTLTQTWNRTAVVIIPHRSTYEVLSQSFHTGFDVDGHGKNALSAYILDRFLAAPEDPIAQRDVAPLLHEIARLKAADSPIPFQPSGAVRGRIVQYALKTGNFALLDEYTGSDKKLEAPLPPAVFGWIGQFLKAQPKTTLRRTKEALSRAIRAYTSLGPRFQAVVNMAPPDEILSPELFVFVREALPVNIIGRLLAGFEDGGALVDVAAHYYDADTFFNALLPLVKERAANAPLVIGFLSRLLERLGTSPLFQGVQAKELYTHLVRELVPQMKLCAAIRCTEDEDGSLKEKPALEPQRLADFFLDLAKEEMMAEVDMAVKNILESREDIRGTAECLHFWLPFLRRLVDTYREHGVPFESPPYRYLYRGLLEVYLFRYVEPEPPAQEPSLVRAHRPPRSSESPLCELCQGASDFLLSATRREVTYQLPALRRRHVEAWFHDDWPEHRRTIPGIRKALNREARPYFTVTFRKTSSWDPDARAERARRRARAERELLRLDRAALAAILGPDDHRAVLDMAVLRRGAQQVEVPAAPPPGPPAAAAATPRQTRSAAAAAPAPWSSSSPPPGGGQDGAPAPAAMAGVKRKLDEAMGLLAAVEGGRGGAGCIASVRRKLEEAMQMADESPPPVPPPPPPAP